MVFKPFVLEAFGTFGNDAVEVCRSIGEAATDFNCGWSGPEAMLAAASAVSMALHRGNAQVIRTAVLVARRAMLHSGPGRKHGAKDRQPRAQGSGRPAARRG